MTCPLASRCERVQEGVEASGEELWKVGQQTTRSPSAIAYPTPIPSDPTPDGSVVVAFIETRACVRLVKTERVKLGSRIACPVKLFCDPNTPKRSALESPFRPDEGDGKLERGEETQQHMSKADRREGKRVSSTRVESQRRRPVRIGTQPRHPRQNTSAFKSRWESQIAVTPPSESGSPL